MENWILSLAVYFIFQAIDFEKQMWHNRPSALQSAANLAYYFK